MGGSGRTGAAGEVQDLMVERGTTRAHGCQCPRCQQSCIRDTMLLCHAALCFFSRWWFLVILWKRTTVNCDRQDCTYMASSVSKQTSSVCFDLPDAAKHWRVVLMDLLFFFSFHCIWQQHFLVSDGHSVSLLETTRNQPFIEMFVFCIINRGEKGVSVSWR